MNVVFSEKCLEYESPGHPESPQRIKSAFEYLKEKRFPFIRNFTQATEEDLLLAHTKEHVQRIKTLNFFNPDTPALTGIFDYCTLAAGAAIKVMELSLDSQGAFSLMRPPGHHAGRDFLGGFCYFNNIAVATQKALLLGKRVAILDLDCHHGNGTQDIFLGKEGVLYVSLHQSPLYPGTGLVSEKNCLNYPLINRIGEIEYLDTLITALSKIKDFQPNLLAVSMGFDTYKEDPLTQMGLERKSFAKIAQLIAQTGIPVFCVLEGGYSQDIKYCIYEFLNGFDI